MYAHKRNNNDQTPQATNTAQARINALKQQQTRASDAFNAERERQQQAKAAERVQKAQQALTKARLP